MSLKNLKVSTKDIDLVITKKEEIAVLRSAMQQAGYGQTTEKDEFYLTALAVYEKGDSRIDLFYRQIGRMLYFSERMQERASLFYVNQHLKVYLASNEDIFLFKTMTSRIADLDDCELLIKHGLDYDIIYEECVKQSQEKHWYFWLFETLCELEQRQILTPLKTKLLIIIKQHWQHRPDSFLERIKNPEQYLSEIRRGKMK